MADDNENEKFGNFTPTLHQAAAEGRVPDLLAMLEASSALNEDVNSLDEESRTPLAYAVLSDSLECVTVLLERGADPNLFDLNYTTPCHWACTLETADILELLFSFGGRWDAVDGESRSLLHYACTPQASNCLQILITIPEMVDYFLNAQDAHGMTPLHIASVNARFHHVAAFVAHGARGDITDYQSRTALHWAVEAKSLLCSKLLIEGCPESLNLADGQGSTPLHIATMIGDSELASLLVSYPSCVLDVVDNEHRTPLHWAVASGHESIATVLLQSGANTRVKDNANGCTAAHYTTQHGGGSTDVLRAILEQDSGAWTVCDHEGRSVLAWAALRNNTPALNLLLNPPYSAALDQPDLDGRTELYLAVLAGNVEAAELLLKHGADPNSSDAGLQPMIIHCGEQGVTEMLRVLLQSERLSSEVVDADGRTALHWACLNGHQGAADLLLAKNASLAHIVDDEGRTALMYACYQGHFTIVEMLVQGDCDVNVRDHEGATALHWAALNGYQDIVQLLMASGAEINVVTETHTSPLDFALSSTQTAVAEFLISQGGVSGDETALMRLSETRKPSSPGEEFVGPSEGLPQNKDNNIPMQTDQQQEISVFVAENDQPEFQTPVQDVNDSARKIQHAYRQFKRKKIGENLKSKFSDLQEASEGRIKATDNLMTAVQPVFATIRVPKVATIFTPASLSNPLLQATPYEPAPSVVRNVLISEKRRVANVRQILKAAILIQRWYRWARWRALRYGVPRHRMAPKSGSLGAGPASFSPHRVLPSISRGPSENSRLGSQGPSRRSLESYSSKSVPISKIRSVSLNAPIAENPKKLAQRSISVPHLNLVKPPLAIKKSPSKSSKSEPNSRLGTKKLSTDFAKRRSLDLSAAPDVSTNTRAPLEDTTLPTVPPSEEGITMEDLFRRRKMQLDQLEQLSMLPEIAQPVSSKPKATKSSFKKGSKITLPSIF